MTNDERRRLHVGRQRGREVKVLNRKAVVQLGSAAVGREEAARQIARGPHLQDK